MTLDEAIASAIQDINEKGPSPPCAWARSLELFIEYFPRNAAIDYVTPARVRDFLSRWYAEKASYTKLHDSSIRDGVDETSRPYDRPGKAPQDKIPEPEELINALAFFFSWADDRFGSDLLAQCLPVLDELKRTLPRAVKITTVLSRALAGRGGAFGFAEFLTSFEAGGHSRYDIDVPDKAGSIEGYFRVTRIEGSSIEAEEIITEQQVWPVIFPQGVIEHLAEGFIINLELVHASEGWQIAACGFAYPPSTEL
jgi:hypothetical protein